MDLRRLRAGEWIAAISGAALLLSLFLPWYGSRDSLDSLPPQFVSEDHTAWEALAVNDVLLALVGACGIAVLVISATQPTAALPLALDGLLAFFGLVAVVLVLVRIAWLPDVAETREVGLWLALAGALGVMSGGWRAMADERLPGADRPDVEAMPAPRS